jgi:AcrR family transcriptional regulator
VPSARPHPERAVEPHRRPAVAGPEPVVLACQAVDQRPDFSWGSVQGALVHFSNHPGNNISYRPVIIIRVSSAPRSRGRPRDRRIDKAVGRATLDLLDERGYGGVSVEAVAARAGVGKPAIYRRFASKPELVFAHAIHGPRLGPPPDTGSLRTDLAALVRGILDTLAAPVAAAAVPGLLADLGRDPELATRFQATFIEQERGRVIAVLGRAVRRGELARPPDPALVHACLLGPVFAWLFLLRGSPGRDLAERLAAFAAAALQADRPFPPETRPPRRERR